MALVSSIRYLRVLAALRYSKKSDAPPRRRKDTAFQCSTPRGIIGENAILSYLASLKFQVSSGTMPYIIECSHYS
jgi:hypothetical protein